MPGAELTTSVRGGRVVVALRGDLDVTGAADGAIAYCYRVIAAAAAAAARTGPLRSRMRR
jgi:hypothetical protein